MWFLVDLITPNVITDMTLYHRSQITHIVKNVAAVNALLR